MKKNGLCPVFEEINFYLQERLKTPNLWFPYPAMISVGLILVLSGHLLPGLNPRLGSQATIIGLDAPEESAGSIWLGIYPKDNKLSLITSEKKIFSWPISGMPETTKKRIVRYLKFRSNRESISAGLTLSTSLAKVSAVIAVDQRLKYHSIVPIIKALADSKISKYSFETRLVER